MPLILPLLAAIAPPPVPLKPTGPWIVRAEENLCLLERSYPVGNKRLSLIFQPLLDLTTMEVFVIGGDKKGDRQFTGDFKADVQPGARDYDGRYFSVVGRSKYRITRLSVDRTILDELRDGEALRIQAKPIDLSFVIVKPDAARIALTKCIDGLKKAWGIDSADRDRVATPLDGNPARYFSTSDYPPEAYRNGIYGRVVALLNIDAAGAVSNCRILSSAGPALNAGTCRAAMRIRFKPARDMDGKPLPTTYILPVHWVLPGLPD